MRTFLLALAMCGALLAQVTQKEINEAIRKGAEYLKNPPQNARNMWGGRTDELVALTLVHAGVKAGEEPVAGLIKKVVKAPLAATYNVAIQALLLMCADPKRYRERIADCGQFLVDSQLPNGQWTYNGSEQQKPERMVVSGPGESAFRLRGKANGTAAGGVRAFGDNSNTQYGMVGLWVMSMCGIKVPESTTQRAEDWWKKTQCDDGSWGYMAVEGRRGGGTPSMTCAGVAAMTICGILRGKPSTDADEAAAGLRWLGGHFTVAGGGYYMYSLERAGTIANVKLIGGHDWYQEGAKALVEQQTADGSWSEDVVETCFAILFLKRATLSLLVTGHSGERASVTPDDPAEEPAEVGKDRKK